MRHPRYLVFGTAVLFALVGCAPTPEPVVTRTASQPPTPSATPALEPVVEPAPAFDVTCADVADAVAAVIGEPSTPVLPVMSTVSTMGWIAGPAQYMFQRAGGIACSAGGSDDFWEILLFPGAEAVIAGVDARIGVPMSEGGSCSADGYCGFEITEGDVHLSALFVDPDLDDSTSAGLDAALRGLVRSAAEDTRDVEIANSDIEGARCERFVTIEELSALLGTEVKQFAHFGGWGVPAEVYNVVDRASHCLYTSPGAGYEVSNYLQITTLPAGRWAFERQDGVPVVVEGADEAKASSGELGESFLDVRVGDDWIRFTTYEGESGARDPLPIATRIVRNLTVGHLAPQ